MQHRSIVSEDLHAGLSAKLLWWRWEQTLQNLQVHGIGCVIANRLCDRVTSLQIQMAYDGPRGLRLQQYQRYQEWSLACKVSDFVAMMLYRVLILCRHTIQLLLWCIGLLRKLLMLDFCVSFLVKMVNTAFTCWTQGYAVSSWPTWKITHGWSQLAKKSCPATRCYETCYTVSAAAATKVDRFH